MKEYSMHRYWEERLREHFDLTGAGHAGLGPRYNRWLYKVRLEALQKALTITKHTLRGTRVLEAGCGTGFYTEWCLRQEVASYVGVDITSISVEVLQKRYTGFRFVQADISADRLPEVGTDFDVVLAADVLFHIIDDKAFEQAIRNLCSVLRAGGLLIISDVFPALTVQVAQHVCLRSMDVYNDTFKENSMHILHVEPIFAILQPPPFIPDSSWVWRGYALFGRLVWRLARWNAVDYVLPPILAWLDRKLFCPQWGPQAPNNKWLLAIKG